MSNYWAKRQKQLKTALAKDEERLRKRLSSFYSTESKRLEKEIASYFSQYGEDNVIEYRKMMESLSDSDRNLLFEKYEKFVEQYPEYTHLMPVRESIYKLDRLQGLQYSVQLQQLKLGAEEIGIIKEHLTKNGLRALAASQEAIGVGTNFLTMNENIVKQFVDVPWANNQKFSDTIWKNKEKLTNYLNTDLAQGFARGDSYDRIVKRMTERFEKVSKNDAFRLVYTEGTFVMNEAAMQPFTSDFEYYKIATVEDNKVCPICAAMQRESEALVAIDSPFEISNRTPGENFPPFHPWCRCSFEIVVEDWDQWMDDYVAKHGGDRETAEKIQDRLENSADSNNDSEMLVEAVHITNEGNIESLLKNGFDLSRSGAGAGNIWGDGAYFSNDKFTQKYYMGRLNTETGVKSVIDTQGFLKLEFTESTSGIGEKLYDEAAKYLTKEEINAYRKLKKQAGAEAAFKQVSKDNYPGIIIKENHDREYFDWRTGGDQIVVFDLRRIKKSKRARK